MACWRVAWLELSSPSADNDQDSGDGLGFRGATGELIGGEGNSVPESGSAGGDELADAMGNEFLVAGEILDEQDRIGETDHESKIIRPSDDLLHEIGGGFLLELEASLNGCAGVDDEAEAQRQLGLVAEVQ